MPGGTKRHLSSHQGSSSPGHLPAAAGPPEAEPENPGNVPLHQPPCDKDRTRGGRSRRAPSSASSQVEPGLPAQGISLHHTHSSHGACGLSRPTPPVLNWVISRSTENTTEPKEHPVASRPMVQLPPALETSLRQQVLHLRGVAMAKERS